ncbi:sel1 repeat family protein [Aequorivita sp. H23M31]|uniref:Sel1 repeat family protein n=1 Tax=Aequorivita ciconiae TaxID=2494375 RepID=A0A410G488_9FLAO|nr:tetratricopeptide repeat protein [Aequorivita sp. H23M31]QAA82087.1 sel1 repeat family protein [Aequorivita sp. H23M31]
MNKIIIFLLLTIISSTSFGQNAAELNEQAIKFIETQEFDKAVPLLEKAAELGSAESQYNLGYCYQAGIGVEQDSEKAVEWYSKSAEQGWNDGLYAMMMAYGNGSGVKQDFNKAFAYAVKCAENEDGTCMYNVINCYKEGLGTDKDLDKMLEWAIRLGKLETPEDLQKSGYITSARLNLAYMYRDGTDVEKDLVKSYHWFLIFNESKKDFSYIQQQQIVEEIQELENKLTTEQKADGQKEAEKLLGRPLRNKVNLFKAEI